MKNSIHTGDIIYVDYKLIYIADFSRVDIWLAQS